MIFKFIIFKLQKLERKLKKRLRNMPPANASIRVQIHWNGGAKMKRSIQNLPKLQNVTFPLQRQALQVNNCSVLREMSLIIDAQV